MLQFLVFLFGCAGSLLFIFKNPRIQLYGSVFYMVSNILGIYFFFMNNMLWLVGQNVIFLCVSIAMFFNRIKFK